MVAVAAVVCICSPTKQGGIKNKVLVVIILDPAPFFSFSIFPRKEGELYRERILRDLERAISFFFLTLETKMEREEETKG